VTSTVVAAGVLAKTGEAAKSGPLGLALILVLCVACYFLFKSMSKHLKKVREEFPTTESGPSATAEPVSDETPSATAAEDHEPADEKAPPVS